MRRRRVRVEWKLQDAWVGAFWKHREWWGGTMEALEALVPCTRCSTIGQMCARRPCATATENYEGDKEAFKHRRFDLWVCLIPMVPIHFESLFCPEPRECRSHDCWVRDVGSIDVRVAVDMGDSDVCARCQGTQQVPARNYMSDQEIPGQYQPCPDCTCSNCHGSGRVHNLAMGPPHPSECSWCSIPCPSCQSDHCITPGCGHLLTEHRMLQHDISCLACDCREWRTASIASGGRN